LKVFTVQRTSLSTERDTGHNSLAQLAAIQDNLRVELYQGLADAIVANVDTNLADLGKRTILPSSFSGGTRYMQQLCQDALAINRYFGGGDLFITMTANPAWPEIKDALLYNQTAAECPDLITRVFHAKLHSLIKDIKNGVLGETLGHLYTIEFQKRGLPHAHIIVFLTPHAKLCTPEQIDSLMSSELPMDDPELLELIKQYMIHGPCGAQNKDSAPWLVVSALKDFPSPSMSTPLSLMTPMQGPGISTLARLFKRADIRLTTDGLSVIASFSSGSTGVTSMWSLLPQSKQSSTSTSMSTRAMTAPQ
jgi:hypothetical protein